MSDKPIPQWAVDAVTRALEPVRENKNTADIWGEITRALARAIVTAERAGWDRALAAVEMRTCRGMCGHETCRGTHAAVKATREAK